MLELAHIPSVIGTQNIVITPTHNISYNATYKYKTMLEMAHITINNNNHYIITLQHYNIDNNNA